MKLSLISFKTEFNLNTKTEKKQQKKETKVEKTNIEKSKKK